MENQPPSTRPLSASSQASDARKKLAAQGLLTLNPTPTEKALAGLSVTGKKIDLKTRSGLGGRKKTKRNRRSKRTRRSQRN